MDINQIINILVHEKNVPAEINNNQVYLLHWTIPDEDGLVGASRTSIHLFKTLKGLAEYLLSESCLESIQELRNNFQNDGEEEGYVWDIIIEEVEE